MVLVWVWYGFDMVIAWFWYCFGMVLVWFLYVSSHGCGMGHGFPDGFGMAFAGFLYISLKTHGMTRFWSPPTIVNYFLLFNRGFALINTCDPFWIFVKQISTLRPCYGNFGAPKIIN